MSDDSTNIPEHKQENEHKDDSKVEVTSQNITPQKPKDPGGLKVFLGRYLPVIFAVFWALVLFVSWWQLERVTVLTFLPDKFSSGTSFDDLMSASGRYGLIFFGFSLTSLSIMITNLKDDALQNSARHAAKSFVFNSIVYSAFLLLLIGFVSIVHVSGSASRPWAGWWWAWLIMSATSSGVIWLFLFISLVWQVASYLQIGDGSVQNGNKN